MKTLLLTAFDAFGGETINPSWEVAKALDGLTIANTHVRSWCLPCAFTRSITELETAIASVRPQAVIALGQAGGRAQITPEYVAINWDDARIPDNDGQQPLGQKIAEHAPNAYFSTLPVKNMVHALRQQGIPAAISYSAGTFVCNHVFYGLQHRAAEHGIAHSGFVHIPYLPEQAAQQPTPQPSMSQQTLIDGLRLIIGVLAHQPHDQHPIAMGSTH